MPSSASSAYDCRASVSSELVDAITACAHLMSDSK